MALLLSPGFLTAQTFGPYSPATGSNSTDIGTNAWNHPTRISSSNNQDATANDNGTTNFGFALQSTEIVSGIRLDVERTSSDVNDVALRGSWTIGTNRTLPAG